MPIRNTDQLEQFQPLGAPIRQEPAKPAPQPEPVGNGLWRSADGKLETRIPPPAISPAQRQGMWQRDAGHQWLTITKQVQNLPAAKDWPSYVRYEPEHRTALQAQRDEIVSKIRDLQGRHRLELEPYMQMLARIDACSLPPRFVTPMDSPNFDFQAVYRLRDLPKNG